MDFTTWEAYYQEILLDLRYSRKEDEEGARLLQELISQGVGEKRIEDVEASISHLGSIMKGKKGYVFGGGPNLQSELDRIVKMELFNQEPWEEYNPAADFTLVLEPPEWKKNMVPIACDGATRAVMEGGIVPMVIVTDLDGEVEFQLDAARKGAILVVHAHGDNKEALKKWLPLMEGKVIPTCQCGPRGDVKNFGGFTDGDRAVFLAEALGARTAVLVGFDFNTVGEKPGNASFNKAVKGRKLVWASLLIELIKEKINVIYFNKLPVF